MKSSGQDDITERWGGALFSSGWEHSARTDTVGGGGGNSVMDTASYATIPGGSHGAASHYGEMAYAGGSFANPGDAQTSVYVLRSTTTDSAWHELFLDGSSKQLTIADGCTLTFDIWVAGRSSDALSAGYHLWGVIENTGGLISFVGGSWSSTLGEDNDAWNVRAHNDNDNSALAVEVLGNGETIRWVAYVRTVEVAWQGAAMVGGATEVMDLGATLLQQLTFLAWLL